MVTYTGPAKRSGLFFVMARTKPFSWITYVSPCMLSLHSFKKSFGDQLILDIPQLDFAKGIHWVKGKNGSGKSTLFNCLAGLSPYKGSIKLGEYDLQKQPETYRMLVNYSQSEPAFPEFLKGDELIGFFARLKQAKEDQTNELKNLLGVEAYAHQACGTYSSGMLKKLSILLAFLGQPEWIILDEPLITLDKEAQAVVTELVAAQKDRGCSFLFATHQDFENDLIKATATYEVKNQTISQTA